MFVSLLQQHLGAESGSAFRSGQLMHANLAPETRLLITNRIHLPECQASQARRSVLIPYGPNMDQVGRALEVNELHTLKSYYALVPLLSFTLCASSADSGTSGGFNRESC